MPVYHIKRLVRPETLRQIGPKSLLALLKPHRKFFADHGLELPLLKDGAKLNVEHLSHLLASHDLHPPRDLADALFFINEMATRQGMDALAPELAANSEMSMFDVEPADVAVRAWLKDRDLVERKHAEICASRPRRFEYFQCRTDPPPRLPELNADTMGPLEGYLDQTFAAKGRGRGVRVLAYPHEDNCLFMVRHGDPRRREGALEGTQETSVLYRPLRFDVVGYDASTGALRVHAKTKWEVSLYRNAFGLHLFGAIDHFPETGRYTLEPLRTGDRACLACADAAPVSYVTLIEVHLQWGGLYDAVETHKASDVLAALRQRKSGVPQGPRIILATFDVFVFGEKVARRVTVIPPNIARYSHEDEIQAMDQWLGLRGFIRGRKAGVENEQPAQRLLPIP